MAHPDVVSFSRKRLEQRLQQLQQRKMLDLSLTREQRQQLNKAIVLCEKCLASGEVLDAYIDRMSVRYVH